LLHDMQMIFGHERYVVLARELTKQFETIHGATLKDLINWVENDPNQQRGEFVVLIQGQQKISHTELDSETQRIATILLSELPLKQAVKLAAQITKEKKNRLYAYAITHRAC